MSKKLRTEAVDHLFDAILSLENREECYTFFEDVCTVNELLSLSQRFEVAKMLRDQKTYLDIAEKTGASTATISRVNTVAKAIQSTQTRGPRPPKKRSVAQPAVNIPRIPEISKAATIQPAC